MEVVVICGSLVFNDRNFIWKNALDCVMSKLLMEPVFRSCSEYLLKCDDVVFFKSSFVSNELLMKIIYCSKLIIKLYGNYESVQLQLLLDLICQDKTKASQFLKFQMVLLKILIVLHLQLLHLMVHLQLRQIISNLDYIKILSTLLVLF